MPKSRVKFDEIFDTDYSGGLTFLESKTARFFLEVTLNFPRVPQFLKLTSDKQKTLYLRILQDIKCCLGTDTLILSSYAYEVNRDGQLHCHACFISSVERTHFPLGVISDVVKTYLKQLPKKYCLFNTHHMYATWLRYNGVGICVQYRQFEDKTRLMEWETYVKKYI